MILLIELLNNSCSLDDFDVIGEVGESFNPHLQREKLSENIHKFVPNIWLTFSTFQRLMSLGYVNIEVNLTSSGPNSSFYALVDTENVYIKSTYRSKMIEKILS